MGSLTSSGYAKRTYDEWVAFLVTEAQSQYGVGVKTDADSVLGRFLRIVARGLAEEDEATEAVWQAFDPASAVDVALDNILALLGLTRTPATSSQVTVTLTGTDGTVIPSGTQLRNPTTGDVWATDGSATIPTGGGPTGSITATATCTETGAVAAAAGTITEIVTPVAGLTSVTNADPATPGSPVETNSQARQRRLRRLAAAGCGTVDAIRAAVLEGVDVAQCVVYQNNTGAVDADSRPAHSLEVVTQGLAGATEIAALAAIIWRQASAGIEVYGLSSTTHTDATGQSRTIYYSEATVVDVYTRLTSTTLSNGGSFTSGKQEVITQAILDAFAQASDTVSPAIGTIGEDVYYEALRAAVFGTIFDDGSRIIAGTFRTGITAPAAGITTITIGAREVGRLQTANIAYS